ncbi:MAG TPA: glycosyl hydrolase family 28 protein [Acidobacteriaceae bacterium]
MFCTLALIVPTVFSVAANAQATGDGRGTVPEPTFPTVCTQVPADLTISAGEPSSELNTNVDTAAIQTALSGCAQGQAVELVANGSNNAFVIAPIFIPAGVTLLVDGGVTVFGSRNPVDYQIGTGTSCGTSDGGSGCNPLITLGQNSVNGSSSTLYSATQPVTGLMGYGVINGRGGDKLITVDSQTNPTSFTVGASSPWDLAVGGNEDVPILMMIPKVANVILYKITLLNSPHFHVKISGQGNLSDPKSQTNLTVWGIKLLTPWSTHNTDGIDPTGANNVTITNSLIGDGDDEIAISGSSLSANFTFSNLLLTSGHGVSIGSITTKGVSNVLATNLNFSGQAADSNEIALRIKSYCSVGGPVSNITYNGVCVRNVATTIDLDPFYSSGSGTSACPAFGTATAPITYQNIYATTTSGRINLQGFDPATAPSYVVLNNVFVNSSTLNLRVNQSADTTPTPANDNITLNGSYYPAQWPALASTTNSVTETNNATAAAAFPTDYCANAFPTLAGEIYANTTTGGATANNINQPTTVTLPSTVTLNAMLQPTNPMTGYGAAAAAAAPTAAVQFLDGTTVVGTASLGTNGTLASVTLTNPAAGVHNYTAQYAGDTHYSVTAFGTAISTGTQNGTPPPPTPLVITVNAGPDAQLAFSTPPPASLTYGASAGTVTVAVQDVAGDQTASTATVTLTVTATGYSQTYNTAAVAGTATFSLGAVLPVGSYTYTAISDGLTSANAGETVTPATLTVTATAASRIFGAPNPAFAYTIAGYVNNDPTTVVSGAPVIATTANRTSPTGTYPTTVSQGTLTAANYNFALIGSTMQVNGGAPQSIIFAPLPNFPSGGTYQLTARTTSGLPVTYTVSGPAQITASSLNVTSPGQITVTASSASNANYAAAQNISQTFTAQ